MENDNKYLGLAIAIIILVNLVLCAVTCNELRAEPTYTFDSTKPFTIEWVPTSGATSYQVHKSIDDADYILVATVTTSYYQDTGTDLQRLRYKVIPMDGDTQVGSPSDPSIRCVGIDEIILPTQPGQPKLVQEN